MVDHLSNETRAITGIISLTITNMFERNILNFGKKATAPTERIGDSNDVAVERERKPSFNDAKNKLVADLNSAQDVNDKLARGQKIYDVIGFFSKNADRSQIGNLAEIFRDPMMIVEKVGINDEFEKRILPENLAQYISLEFAKPLKEKGY